MNETLNIIFATAVGVGLPAMIGLLWRMGNQLTAVRVELQAMSLRVTKLERGEG